MSTSPLQRAGDDFAAQLNRWRTQRGLTKSELAGEMGFDPSYVSHVEGRRHRPTEDFARRAEAVLRSGGAIWRSYATYEALRETPPAAWPPVASPVDLDGAWFPPGSGLVIECEQAVLGLLDGLYQVRVRRQLYNAGPDPVVRFPVRIHVDRHPRRATARPDVPALSWAEIGFSGQTGDGEPMEWQPGRDPETGKELWLNFENADRRFPLYPRHRTTIEYAYQLPEPRSGSWFQRSIRLPTHDLAIELDFATRDRPVVWGTVSSLTGEGTPLGPPEVSNGDGERTRFRWSVRSPALQARYRLEWRLAGTVA